MTPGTLPASSEPWFLSLMTYKTPGSVGVSYQNLGVGGEGRMQIYSSGVCEESEKVAPSGPAQRSRRGGAMPGGSGSFHGTFSVHSEHSAPSKLQPLPLEAFDVHSWW